MAMFGPAIRRAGIPLVFWLHTPVTGRHWIERWAVRNAPQLTISNSRFNQDVARHLFPGVASTVIYCPIAPVEAAVPRSEMRRRLETPDDAIVIAQVSRMEALKDKAF